MENFAEPAVTHAHREAKCAVAEIDVLNVRDSRWQPLRQADAQAAELEVVAGAHEMQDALAGIDVKSHAHAGRKRFDERPLARQPLDALDDARFAACKPVDALPGRAAVGRREDVDRGRNVRAREGRNRRADQPAAHREQLAREAGADFIERAVVFRARRVFGKSRSDRRWKRGPLRVPDQPADVRLRRVVDRGDRDGEHCCLLLR
jgi:hypothetical protein